MKKSDARRSGLNVVTKNSIERELQRARRDHPNKDGNLRTLEYFVQQLPLAMRSYDDGQVNALFVYSIAITVAVMAIRVAEEGASNFKYASYVPNPGPLFLDIGRKEITNDE
jgi:hypothetical protein